MKVGKYLKTTRLEE